jgi:hypothetical protein
VTKNWAALHRTHTSPVKPAHTYWMIPVQSVVWFNWLLSTAITVTITTVTTPCTIDTTVYHYCLSPLSVTTACRTVSPVTITTYCHRCHHSHHYRHGHHCLHCHHIVAAVIPLSTTPKRWLHQTDFLSHTRLYATQKFECITKMFAA